MREKKWQTIRVIHWCSTRLWVWLWLHVNLVIMRQQQNYCSGCAPFSSSSLPVRAWRLKQSKLRLTSWLPAGQLHPHTDTELKRRPRERLNYHKRERHTSKGRMQTKGEHTQNMKRDNSNNNKCTCSSNFWNMMPHSGEARQQAQVINNQTDSKVL